MAKQLTADDAKQSLLGHVESKGYEIHLKYGPLLGWSQLQRLLADRIYVRYPCEIIFDASGLLPGEFAHPNAKGENPSDGFIMAVHPIFEQQLDLVPALVLYQMVSVNYGEFASSEEAETFGAAALGMGREEYYAMLCELSDELGSEQPTPDMQNETKCSSGSSCSCHN